MHHLNLTYLIPGNQAHVTAFLEIHGYEPVLWFSKRELLAIKR